MIYTGDVETLDLLGERLCLDFTNTVGTQPAGATNDLLTSYPRLIEWSAYVGVIGEDEAEHLLEWAASHPAEAEAALHYAIAIRQTLYHILAAAAADVAPEPSQMQAFNHILAQAMTHLRLTPGTQGFDWACATDTHDLEKMLWPVVWSAAELLTSHDLVHLRECAGDHCNWLFLDTSKNHSRRWCSMKDCGNRAKAKMHYHRTRQAG
jgi:predicted RNA-binding Zn ribbon-like protein